MILVTKAAISFISVLAMTHIIGEELHKSSQAVTPKLAVYVVRERTKDMNYTSIQEYHAFLERLEIEHEFLSIKDVDHNSLVFYEKGGANLIKFHMGALENAN